MIPTGQFFMKPRSIKMPGHTDNKMMQMQGANNNPLSAMQPEARQNLMKPSDSIAAVLMSRLANMSPEDLKKLDSAITPDVAKVLLMLLPELRRLIEAVENQQQPKKQPKMMKESMGALGSI